MRISATVIGAAFAVPVAIHAQTPAESAAGTFELEKGLRLELVAAEPLVTSPCALGFDARGRMFVAENRGYPRSAKPPLGSIALLEDTDGDGHMDKRTLFADGLTFPNGVLPWKNGVFVTCAPDLLYLEDTDGDGSADVRRVVLTGFATTGSTQLRVNAPLIGPDGSIWLASGLSGGNITAPDHPEFPALQLKSDLRFDPDSGAFEAVDGRSQYGHSFDDAGRRFICMNRIQVQHVVLPSRYLRRNPLLAFSESVQNCPELVPNPLMRGGTGAARIFPISKNITTADSHAGTFSAACSVHIWRGGALPGVFDGCAFSCDPTGNLVHVDKLEPRGATFAAVPLLPNREFLASRDDWFRPVFLARGPDGALYIADMYRKVIEHPDYLPEEIRKRTDFESGRDMGRIWRVMDARSKEVVQRAPTRAEQLRASVLHGSLPDETLARAFASSDPDEREVALELAEPRFAGAPTLIDSALPLASDPNARVRFRFALCVGGIDDQRIASALGSIAGRDHDDRWIRAAALSGATHHLESFLAAVIATDRHVPSRMLDLLAECGRLLAKNELENNAARIAQIVQGLTAESAADVQVALLTGMTDAHGISLDAKWKPLPDLVHREIEIASDTHGDVARRILSVRFLGHTTLPEAHAALRDVALNGGDASLRLAALTAMPEASGATVLAELLTQQRWNALPPDARASLLAVAASRPAFIGELLSAVESGKLPRNAVDTTRRQQLLKHKGADIQKRAEALFGQPVESDRRAAFESAKAALKMQGDGLRGRAVFQKTCATCHRLDREGYAVGPDLFDIRNQPKESILLHIVVPDHEIAPAFAAYVVETTDGRTLQGIIDSESADSVTLRQAQGVRETLLRTKIASLNASTASLMPAGLEQTMTAQELADLLAYLKGEQ